MRQFVTWRMEALKYEIRKGGGESALLSLKQM